MRLYEYEGKELLSEKGIPVPTGQVANNAEEASIAAASLGGAVVVKAQLLAGGRGKAGLIQLANDRKEAGSVAARILDAAWEARGRAGVS